MTQPTYGDPETLLAGWLAGRDIKAWADPVLPPRWDFTAPIAHVQRSPGGGDEFLTLDAATVDVDVYAADADNARTVAARIWTDVRLHLPRSTVGEMFISGTRTISAPYWLPDPAVYRRSATYRMLLRFPR